MTFFFLVILGVYGYRSFIHEYYPPDVTIKIRTGQAVSNARKLGTVLYHYAKDHGFQYPEGNSSTEVFNHLMEQGYLAPENAANLYIRGMPGKEPFRTEQTWWEWMTGTPAPTQLEAKHVCYDVIAPLTHRDPDGMPMIISTGWKLNFEPGALPQVRDQKLLDMPWLQGGMLVYYKRNVCLILGASFLDGSAKPSGIHQLIPEEIDPTKTYRQLTP